MARRERVSTTNSNPNLFYSRSYICVCVQVLGNDCSMKSLARRLRGNKYKNIVILMGAGCSVSAGIPDFRTKGAGLYSQVKKYNLPYAEAIFDLHYFNEVDKTPFHKIAKVRSHEERSDDERI